MIRSMTGYGRAVTLFDDLEISVEIKAVNSRGLDLSIRLPRSFSPLEDRLKKLISASVTRGKLDVYCHARSLSTSNAEISLDEPLARQYIDALHTLRDTFSLKDDITVSTVARNGELFLHHLPDEDIEEIWAKLEEVANDALSHFNDMREREGRSLAADFDEKLNNLESFRSEIAQKAPETVKLYQERLHTKLTELVGANYDDARLLTEVALLADRVAIDEELTRLKSHIDQFRTFLKQDKPVGHQLNFLTQELNRETNTIGSKCSRLEITSVVIQLKTEIEKIREQIQNVE